MKSKPLILVIAIGVICVARCKKSNSIPNKFSSIHLRNSVLHGVYPEEKPCTIIVKAMPIPSHKFFGQYEYVGNIPNIPGLKISRWPSMIPGSCSISGICLWRLHLSNHCDRIFHSAYFVRSSPEDISEVAEFPTSGIGGR